MINKSISPWIQTTDMCNLACEYCHIRGDNTMGKETYDAIKRFLLSGGFSFWSLRMAGGEPLMVFDKWYDFAVDMLDDERTHIEILTNLRHIPNGLINFLNSGNIHVSVSIDGGGQKVINRDISENIKKLPKKPCIMTVLTNGLTENLSLLAAFIAKNGLDWHISTDYFFKGNSDNLIVKMVETIEILKHFEYDFNKFCFNNIKFNGQVGGCCAGDELITIDTNGDIYRCQTELNKSNRIGDIFTGYNPKKFSTKKDNCNGCSINGICSGWCPIYHVPGINYICDLMKFVVYEIKKEGE